MADSADSAFAEGAASTNTSESHPATDHHEATGQEGDNKFQKAISAWRSMILFIVHMAATKYL
jgi:homeobox protein cut-like